MSNFSTVETELFKKVLNVLFSYKIFENKIFKWLYFNNKDIIFSIMTYSMILKPKHSTENVWFQRFLFHFINRRRSNQNIQNFFI